MNNMFEHVILESYEFQSEEHQMDRFEQFSNMPASKKRECEKWLRRKADLHLTSSNVCAEHLKNSWPAGNSSSI